MKSHHENEVTWNPGLSDSLRRGLRKVGNDIGKIRNWFVNSRDRLRPKILYNYRNSHMHHFRGFADNILNSLNGVN